MTTWIETYFGGLLNLRYVRTFAVRSRVEGMWDLVAILDTGDEAAIILGLPTQDVAQLAARRIIFRAYNTPAIDAVGTLEAEGII